MPSRSDRFDHGERLVAAARSRERPGERRRRRGSKAGPRARPARARHGVAPPDAVVDVVERLLQVGADPVHGQQPVDRTDGRAAGGAPRRRGPARSSSSPSSPDELRQRTIADRAALERDRPVEPASCRLDAGEPVVRVRVVRQRGERRAEVPLGPRAAPLCRGGASPARRASRRSARAGRRRVERELASRRSHRRRGRSARGRTRFARTRPGRAAGRPSGRRRETPRRSGPSSSSASPTTPYGRAESGASRTAWRPSASARRNSCCVSASEPRPTTTSGSRGASVRARAERFAGPRQERRVGRLAPALLVGVAEQRQRVDVVGAARTAASSEATSDAPPAESPASARSATAPAAAADAGAAARPLVPRSASTPPRRPPAASPSATAAKAMSLVRMLRAM